MLINLNGKIVRPEEATIPVLDHGFLFGDSIYEVVRTANGRLFTAREHLERLRQSAEALWLRIPLTDEEFIAEMERTHRESGNEESYIRIIVTRGVGVINLHPESCQSPNWILIVKPLTVWPEAAYRDGIKVSLVGIRRNPDNALSPRIKSGNYLNNVIALVQARKAGAEEGIMLNPEGWVTEGTTSNVWIVKDGEALTPALEHGLLRGITRSLVLDLAKKNGVPARETRLDEADLFGADEVFLTGSTRNVMPVHQINGRVMGNGQPGPVTQQLRALLEALLKAN